MPERLLALSGARGNSITGEITEDLLHVLSSLSFCAEGRERVKALNALSGPACQSSIRTELAGRRMPYPTVRGGFALIVLAGTVPYQGLRLAIWALAQQVCREVGPQALLGCEVILRSEPQVPEEIPPLFLPAGGCREGFRWKRPDITLSILESQSRGEPPKSASRLKETPTTDRLANFPTHTSRLP